MAKRKPAAKQGENGRAGRAKRASAAGRASNLPTAGKSSAAKAERSKPAARKPAQRVAPVVAKKRSSGSAVALRAQGSLVARRDGKALPAAKPEIEVDIIRQTNLTDAELVEFRDLLLEKRRELVGDMNNMSDEARRAGAPGGTASSMPIHMADLGSDTWEQELTLGLIENERGLLREIDEALDRIDKKTYGICIATNKPIGKARLRFKPWAKYCIDYARKQEQGRA